MAAAAPVDATDRLNQYSTICLLIKGASHEDFAVFHRFRTKIISAFTHTQNALVRGRYQMNFIWES